MRKRPAVVTSAQLYLAAALLLSVSGCAGKAPVIINGERPMATLTFLQQNFSVCVRGTWNNFSAEKTAVIIPAEERITLKSRFEVNDGSRSPDCEQKLSFVAGKDQHYIGDILVYDKGCVIDVVSENEREPNGLSKVEGIASAQGNCR